MTSHARTEGGATLTEIGELETIHMIAIAQEISLVKTVKQSSGITAIAVPATTTQLAIAMAGITGAIAPGGKRLAGTVKSPW